MAANPLITFKAGKCDFHGKKVKSVATPGYVYIYTEDEIPHFCWRPRNAPASDPEIDLFMVPGDGRFEPWLKEQGAEDLNSPTNGRIYVLRFESSSQKHFFWMQSRSQHKEGNPSWFSQRDQRLGQIVNAILQGEEVDVEQEIEEMRQGGGGEGDQGDNEDEMDLDEQPSRQRHGSTGGAGADATGGDPSHEGEASREGGADGGRAAGSSSESQDPSALVQNFLRSLQGGSGGQQQQQNQQADKPFTTLPDLLPASTTIPYIDNASGEQIDLLCSYLPPDIFVLSQESEQTLTTDAPTEPAGSTTSAAQSQAAIEALSTDQKKEIVKRVLHSPQLQQSLGSLTVALRDGGLPMIGEALGLKVENGGLIRHSSLPLGGGQAVEAFVEGVKKTVEKEDK